MNPNLNLLSEVAVVLRNWEEDKRWLFDDYSIVADFIRFCAAVKSKSFLIVPRKKRSSLRRRPNKKTNFGFPLVPVIIPKERRSLRRRAAASLGMTSTNLKRKRLSGFVKFWDTEVWEVFPYRHAVIWSKLTKVSLKCMISGANLPQIKCRNYIDA
ncbi:hypothetical protein C1H46_016726 [Malus baccata]|uniref:Uncharacterized protein n=1 Tax=Malus baccata TaxID=106549 RepID=A0A540MGH0_MALBA|nr:hypothetical protein C1H46_016726 [Malus baccata]